MESKDFFSKAHQPFILVILHNNFGPYHVARLAALTQIAASRGIEVIGIELASLEMKYPWTVEQKAKEIQKVTLFPHQALEELSAGSLMRSMWSTLNRLDPQALAICGFGQAEMLTALVWARFRQRMAVLMMDSKYDDYPRRAVKEGIKKVILSLFDAAFVSGTASKQYAQFLGMPPERILTGYDAVDNEFFSRQAEVARDNALRLREQYDLPENFFLCVSRFVEGKGKNLSRLLEAYARYAHSVGNHAWSLVLCGSGPLESRLQQETEQWGIQGMVRFAGFRQVDELPIFYGLANCLIIPSLGDTWSLVVNEAMAAGLPVLVSRACGCALDLVQEGDNGYTFDPYDVESMIQLIQKMASGHVNLKVMGEYSRRIIHNWSLETYSRNLLMAVKAAMTSRNRFHGLGIRDLWTIHH